MKCSQKKRNCHNKIAMIKKTHFMNKMNERLFFAQFDFSQEIVIFDKTDCMYVCVCVSVYLHA